METPLTLTDAISAVEKTQATLAAADTADVAAAQKLAQAQAAKAQTAQDDLDATVLGNDAIDALIGVLTATKRPVPPPAPAAA